MFMDSNNVMIGALSNISFPALVIVIASFAFILLPILKLFEKEPKDKQINQSDKGNISQ